MARVVPVGPIDPELYAFAKKEAEKAERNPRYVPKNCPADRGQIIYKRIGATVKALVVATTELIGMHRTNFTNTYVPYKYSLIDSSYDDIQTYRNVSEVYGAPVQVDGYGDWYSPTYDKVVSGRSKGFADLGQSASVIAITTEQSEKHFTYFAALYTVISTANTSYAIETSTIVRFHNKYLDEAESCKTIVEPKSDDPPPHYNTKKAICLRGKLRVKVVHEFTINTASSGGSVGMHTGGNSNDVSSSSSWDDSQAISEISCGSKDDKFFVLYLRTDSHTASSYSYSSGGGSNNSSTQTALYTLVVNGGERLSKTKETDHQAALAVRIDDDGLAYIFYTKTDELNDRARVFSGLISNNSAYGAISNKYGVFVVVGDSKERKRKRHDGTEYTSRLYFSRIVWIRPKEKYAEDEDAIHLLDDDNSEIIVITPREPPKFGEKDGVDYPEGDEPSWDYSYMLFASTADKNAVIASYDDSIFNVTTIIKRYIASKGTDDEMTAGDVGEWRGVTRTVGANGQAQMPYEAGSGKGRYYMKPGLMHRPARKLIDALYFPVDNP